MWPENDILISWAPGINAIVRFELQIDNFLISVWQAHFLNKDES